MSMILDDIPDERIYETVVRVLAHQFRHGLTPAQAVDYLAVEKAGRATGEWADIRDVDHSTVSGNVKNAREMINITRLDAEVQETEDAIEVHVNDHEGERHELPFKREMSVMGREGTAHLTLVYEARGAIHGHYTETEADEQASEPEQYESTLWYDGRPTNSFEEWDFFDEWGTPEAKANTILWRREE